MLKGVDGLEEEWQVETASKVYRVAVEMDWSD